MPLSAERREEYAKSAFSIINATHGNATAAEISRRIIDRVNERDLGNQTSIFNIARQQLRAYAAGQAMMDADPDTPVTPTIRDDTLLFSAEQYGYKVLVVVRNPLTGERSVQLKEVLTDTAMSPSAVLGRAEAAFQNDPTRGGRYPVLSGPEGAPQVDLFIVSAGVRR